MRVLIIGDVLSKTGRKALVEGLSRLRGRLGIDLCTANVENAAGMFGVTRQVVGEISSSGVDVMTSGNHIFDKREGVSLLDERSDLLRPANYPPGVPGRGWMIGAAGGVPYCVINLQGRTFMTDIDCPFRTADRIIAEIPPEVKVRIVDFHAEATSEKLALAYHLAGRVSAVAGSHTHVPTADERILPGGTAYQTDVGMAGPFDSVIGVRPEQVIERFLTGIPVRFQVGGDTACIEGLFVEIDDASGEALRVERVDERVGEGEPHGQER
ncbi:MAG: TIGR00282 family metallophosphoesterase [Candidatus Krumholzibacteria bacterium]|nr:TIGR00282 family metallophosphoesterase [Candidatus Krumholzibacteria bacterium]